MTTAPLPHEAAEPVLTDTLQLSGRLALARGGHLDDCRVGFRLHGARDRPAVLVLGGISADRHVCACAVDRRRGWWEEVVGPGRAIDTRTHALLTLDYLGGSGTSTGPDEPRDGDAGFPAIGTHDQAAAAVAALDHLGLTRLRAVVGASYGGMVALALAERFPERVEHAVVIGAAHETHPMATAWRAIQRGIVRLAMQTGRSREGMRLARALAMTTYRTAEEFAGRFGGEAVATSSGPCFPVEEYLAHQGEWFAERISPRGFLCLSESTDLHRVDPAAIGVPVTLVAVDSDMLVPPWQMTDLAGRLAGSTLHMVTSLYGHDAFLKESAIANIIAGVLDGRWLGDDA